MSQTLAVIGCGNMGGAVARAVLSGAQGAFAPVLACDPDPAKREAIAGAEPVPEAADAVARAGVVLLAVKPQSMAGLADEIAPRSAGTLVVSVAAGITTAWLESRLPGARVVRTMPNTPLLVGRGAVALCGGATATAADVATTRSLFPGALAVELAESKMDAATATSGSGPAYVFAFVEALAAAGARAGLPPDAAEALARQTLVGAAALLEHSGESPAELRRKVTSPGGTTAAALASFRADEFDEVVARAVEAATRRGRELSGTAGRD